MEGRPCMSKTRRWTMFNAVGVVGLLVQLGCVAILRDVLGFHYLAATAVATELTILHNFCWHVHWTWADRLTTGFGLVSKFVRFNLTNGAVSLVCNTVLTAALVEVGRLHYLAANLISVTMCSVVNFVLSDVFVFACDLLVVSLAPIAVVHAADLRPDAVLAFDRYAHLTEARMDEERNGSRSFLWMDGLPDAQRREVGARVRRGEIVVSRMDTRAPEGPIQFRNAICHHWVGTAFVAGAGLDRVIGLMQSYDRYQDVYRPAVRRSTTLSRDGEHFKVSLQLFMKKIVSVILNTESDVSYLPVTAGRMQVRSFSTRIAEVRDAGTPDEREKPVGRDSGFLWRFNNYCALEEHEDGTVVQCESVSLSRDIPTGLGWLIKPFVNGVPRESLEFTLGAMQRALTQPQRGSSGDD